MLHLNTHRGGDAVKQRECPCREGGAAGRQQREPAAADRPLGVAAPPPHNALKTSLLTALLALAAVAAGRAAHPVAVVPVRLTQSAAIQWDGRNHETIDARLNADPVSIHLGNCADIVISACDLGAIELVECKRVTIRNCWIHDSTNCGVSTYRCQQVLIQGCRFERVASGVYALESQQIQVVGNFARNVAGPFPRGQLAQFDDVTGTGNVIRANYAINDLGQSHPEDVISLFKSAGEQGSPLLIADNYMTGDPTQGSTGKSQNGSGIMLGDSGGAYLTCRSNVIINAGQVGMGVAGGRFIRVEDNLIYGRKSDVANVGLYVWNQSDKPSDHVSVMRNRVYWVNKTGEENSWWNGGNVQEVELKDNHFADAALATDLPAPPSCAPMPPQPWVSPGADGTSVARLPWEPK